MNYEINWKEYEYKIKKYSTVKFVFVHIKKKFILWIIWIFLK